jgi:hypothetical protein
VHEFLGAAAGKPRSTTLLLLTLAKRNCHSTKVSMKIYDHVIFYLEQASQREDKLYLSGCLFATLLAILVIRSWTAAKVEEAVPFVWHRPVEAEYVTLSA